MKKTRLVIILILCVVGGLAAAGYFLWDFLRKDVLYIAVAGPFSGEYQADGENMLKGIQLYLKQLNRSGGLPNKRIKLIIVDDQADPPVAAQVAEQLVQDDRVLLVIGHIYSSESIAAGAFYRKFEIPAITASATAEDVTRGNDWYFRVIPNNAFQGIFVANYVKNSLYKQTASVIAVNDSYGKSLALAFRTTANQIGLKMLREWTLKDENNTDEDLDKIVKGLLTDQPEAVFLASYGIDDDARLLVALRKAGFTATLVGSESFADPSYLDELLAQYGEEGRASAEYTNGMFVVTLFMPETVGKAGFDFLHEYAAEYPDEPLLWSVPCYYDAMHIVVEALKRADLKSSRYIRHNRKQVRAALASFYAPPLNAVEGTSGNIYFDINRDANRPLDMGVYTQSLILPAFTQYQQLSDVNRIPDRIQSALTGDVLMVNDQFLIRTQVVRAGIQVHEVSLIDLENTRYAVDFSLWLRFPQNLDAASLVFPNALTPIQLGSPVFAETVNQITTQVYRVHGEFTNVVDFRHYPFDNQVLAIIFRHATRTLEEIIYVPDRSGVPEFLQPNEDGSQKLPTLPTGWRLQKLESYQSVTQHTVVQFTTPYSEFHTNLQISRRNSSALIAQLATISGIFALLGILAALPEDWIFTRMLLAGLAFMGNLIAHFTIVPGLRFAFVLDLEYAILAGYIISVMLVFVAVSRYSFYRARLDIVNHIPLFESFSATDKIALSKKMQRYHYRRPGKVILRQGDAGDSLFVIVEGEVAFRFTTPDNEIIEVNRLQTGRYFGELALLTGSIRTVSAVTTTPVWLGEIKRRHLIPLIQKQPAMVQSMAQEMARLDIIHAEQRDPGLAKDLDPNALAAGFMKKIMAFLEAT